MRCKTSAPLCTTMLNNRAHWVWFINCSSTHSLLHSSNTLLLTYINMITYFSLKIIFIAYQIPPFMLLQNRASSGSPLGTKRSKARSALDSTRSATQQVFFSLVRLDTSNPSEVLCLRPCGVYPCVVTVHHWLPPLPIQCGDVAWYTHSHRTWEIRPTEGIMYLILVHSSRSITRNVFAWKYNNEINTHVQARINNIVAIRN